MPSSGSDGQKVEKSTDRAEWPEVPPVGTPARSIHYSLILAPEDKGQALLQDPFLQLPTSSRSHRIYLARLTIGDIAVGGETAILMEPASLARGGRSGLDPAATNPFRERAWSAGVKALLSIHSDGVAAPAGYPDPGGAHSESAPFIPLQGPLAYCRKAQTYVDPVCPTCLGALTTCRDDTILRMSGLPSYSTSSDRFLYCPLCKRDSRFIPTFYTWTERRIEPLGDLVRLRHKSALYRDLTAKINSETADPPANHPCFTCEHRGSCYPPGGDTESQIPAEAFLYPVSYYDFPYIGIEPLPLTFEVMAALLGGASLDQSLAETGEPGWENSCVGDETRRVLSAERPQFFFQGDSTGLFVLEVLFLKLTAFTQVVRGILDALNQAGRPHLGLEPAKIRGRVMAGPPHVPGRWSLAMKVLDFVSCAPIVPADGEEVEGEPVIWSLPDPRPEVYLPAAMLRQQVWTRYARIDVTSIDAKRIDVPGTIWIEADVAPEQYIESEHGGNDLVRITLQTASVENPRVVFTGRRTCLTREGFHFSGRSRRLGPAEAQAIGSALPVRSTGGEVTIVHRFSSPADVTALGVLLLRLLLWNDEDKAARVNRLAVEAIASRVRSGPSHGEIKTDNERWESLVEAFSAEGIHLARNHTLFRTEDRQKCGYAAAQETLLEALLLALRMGSNLEDWSICDRQDDFSDENPGIGLRKTLDELERLIERVRGSLVGSGGRNALVLQVCRDFRDDLEEASSPESHRREPSADMTTIARPRSA